MNPRLHLDGLVTALRSWSWAELAAIDEAQQVRDVRQLGAKRPGDAVRLSALLESAGVLPEAQFITLHAAADDFHASVPLLAVRERAVVIYQLDGAPLAKSAGGPFRFFIPDHAACQTHEIDDCANVKFVDRIELSRERGRDNRPHDEAEHARLHANE